MKRKICIITGSRAEYGLLKPLLDEIKSDPDLSLQLIVTGMHLSPEFGLTFSEIEKDGFSIDEKIEILLSSVTSVGVSKAMGLAMISFSEIYKRLKPNIIVVLGDRFEIFSAVAVAHVSQIPVAHISGGEVTEGAFDDAFRHSITKMSGIHFTSCEEYRRRVIQLGEHPDRVFNVGAIGLDNVKRLKLLSKKELENKLNFKFAKRNLLVTFHPVTLEKTTEKQFKNLLTVLNELKDTKIIFTKTNADPGGMTINRIIDEYVVKNPQKAVSFVSMGQLNYLSTMQFVDAVVGNSSSGIVEAPSFKIGTINIGNRQEGRIKAESIIDCEPTKESIKKALQELYSSDFQEKLKNIVNPYGDGNTARRILKVLKAYDIRNILKKTFYDINFEYKTTVM
jgi:GDP/UDP-N,N'-diacetylbacillosamine 2-epimerase (hydrolysing)